MGTLATQDHRVCTGAENVKLKIAATGLIILAGRSCEIVHGYVVGIKRQHGTVITSKLVIAGIAPSFSWLYILMEDGSFACCRLIKLNRINRPSADNILTICIISHVPAILRLRDHILNIVQKFLHARR